MTYLERVVSVSLGDASRDFSFDVEVLGRNFRIERLGVNGNLAKACSLIEELDGQCGAIGLGGVNLFYRSGRRLYPIKEGHLLVRSARSTPVCDGSFVKQWIEPEVLGSLEKKGYVRLHGKRVALVSALDRYHLGLKCLDLGAEVLIGDALFALGLPILFGSRSVFEVVSLLTMPVLGRIPISVLYPMPSDDLKEDEAGRTAVLRGHEPGPLFRIFRGIDHALLRRCDVFLGDFHLMKRALPEDISGKTVITSTVTPSEKGDLLQRGAARVFPLGLSLHGRSLGANALEALLVAVARSIGFMAIHLGENHHGGYVSPASLEGERWISLWRTSGLHRLALEGLG
jgi:hypothetical protein